MSLAALDNLVCVGRLKAEILFRQASRARLTEVCAWPVARLDRWSGGYQAHPYRSPCL